MHARFFERNAVVPAILFVDVIKSIQMFWRQFARYREPGARSPDQRSFRRLRPDRGLQVEKLGELFCDDRVGKIRIVQAEFIEQEWRVQRATQRFFPLRESDEFLQQGVMRFNPVFAPAQNSCVRTEKGK